jgi:hypothetical protein
MKSIKERVEIDIAKFSDSILKANNLKLNNKEKEILNLAKMYASDSKAWLKNGDIETAFSSISYAHGLLDAILKLKNVIE